MTSFQVALISSCMGQHYFFFFGSGGGGGRNQQKRPFPNPKSDLPLSNHYNDVTKHIGESVLTDNLNVAIILACFCKPPSSATWTCNVAVCLPINSCTACTPAVLMMKGLVHLQVPSVTKQTCRACCCRASQMK